MRRFDIFASPELQPCPAGALALPGGVAMYSWTNEYGKWSNSTARWVNEHGKWSNSTASWQNHHGSWSNSSSGGK